MTTPSPVAAWIGVLLLAASAPAMDSTHLPNICWSPTHGPCGTNPRSCRVGNIYSCGDPGECTCYDMNTGCGSDTKLPSGLLGKKFCGYRADANGEECGWCAATSQCSTRTACPASAPAPPPAPTPPPTPRQWRCAALRPQCNTCAACCKPYLSNSSACASCVDSVCHPEAPPVPCELSPYKNVTPAPGVLSGRCKCTVAKPDFPGHLLVYTYSALDYADGASCHMRLPAGGQEYAQPVFATEYQHDFLEINGRNYSGISGEIGDIPHLINVTDDTDMFWRPDDKIVGTGWELTFSVPEPRPPPDPSSAPRVYSGACTFEYDSNKGTGYFTSHFYDEGIVPDHCIIIVPQGWYVSSVSFESKSSSNTLTIGEHVYSGSAGPPVGLQLSGLVRWDAVHFLKHYACVDVAPYVCGFFISISKENPHE